jgi:hypothetical protein
LAETHYGDVTGWVRNVYGDYDPTYPPEWVKRDLTESLRPRLPFPAMGLPYTQEGVLRDPFIEYLSRLQQGQRGRGGQLDYNLLDDHTVAH